MIGRSPCCVILRNAKIKKEINYHFKVDLWVDITSNREYSLGWITYCLQKPIIDIYFFLASFKVEWSHLIRYSASIQHTVQKGREM